MRLFLVMMLGVGLSSPALAEPTGELPGGERLFQGHWQLTSLGSGSSTGTLRIDGREFSAETVHGSYVGSVSIRADRSPAQIDFTIRGCECKFDGMTSEGIYQEDEGGFVLALPVPGEPRPEAITGLDEAKFLIERATRAGGSVRDQGPR